jgi:hypothetical protein
MSFASQVSECNPELRGSAEVPGPPLIMSDELAMVDGAPLATFPDWGVWTRLEHASAASPCSRARPQHAADAGDPLLYAQVRDAVPGSARGGRAGRCWLVASTGSKSAANVTKSAASVEGCRAD